MGSPSKCQFNITLRNHMQADIDYLTNWVFESSMSFNIDKCWSVTFGQPIKHEGGRSYSIKGVSIPHKRTSFFQLFCFFLFFVMCACL